MAGKSKKVDEKEGNSESPAEIQPPKKKSKSDMAKLREDMKAIKETLEAQAAINNLLLGNTQPVPQSTPPSVEEEATENDDSLGDILGDQEQENGTQFLKPFKFIGG